MCVCVCVCVCVCINTHKCCIHRFINDVSALCEACVSPTDTAPPAS